MWNDLKIRIDKPQLFKIINYQPHPAQEKLHSSEARFRVLMCGRRWGKSLSAAMEAVCAMLIPQQRGWVVAPTYELAEKIFREVFWIFNKNEYLKQLVVKSSMSHQGMTIELSNGSKLDGKSADNEVSLLGEGLNFLIVDEASMVKADTWLRALRPTLTDKKGWALFISTPRGKNWFYELYMLGQQENSEYESWSFPTSSNPYVDAAEIDAAQQNYGGSNNLMFRQEYMAEPIESADAYFNWNVITSCIDESIVMLDKKYNEGHEYYLGLDLARMGQDASVFTIVEKDAHDGLLRVVYCEETHHALLNEAIGRAKDLQRRFGFRRIFIDQTGLGAGVVDMLREECGYLIEPITFTIQTKEDMFSNLKMLMETGRLKYPKINKLIAQMQDLRFEYKSTGHMSIKHSDNGFDDYPDSLALAVYFNKFRPNTAPQIMGFQRKT